MTRKEFVKDGGLQKIMSANVPPGVRIVGWWAYDVFGPDRHNPAKDSEIARRAQVSIRTVQTARERLRALGWSIVRIGKVGFWWAWPGSAIPGRYSAYVARALAAETGKQDPEPNRQILPVSTGAKRQNLPVPIRRDLLLVDTLDLHSADAAGEPPASELFDSPEQPKKQMVSAEQPKPKAKPPDQAVVAPLVGAWCKGFRERTGRDIGRARGKTAGILGRLAKEFDPIDVGLAVGRWFAVDRADYGPELFAAKLQGQNAELWGRASPGDTWNQPDDPRDLMYGQAKAEGRLSA